MQVVSGRGMQTRQEAGIRSQHVPHTSSSVVTTQAYSMGLAFQSLSKGGQPVS